MDRDQWRNFSVGGAVTPIFIFLGESAMRRFYAAIFFIVMFPLVSSSVVAQHSTHSEPSSESSIEDTSDDLESFIDSIVDHVEYEVDRLTESRWQSKDVVIESDGDDQDEKSSALDAVTFNGRTEINPGDTIQTDLVVKNGDLIVFGTVAGNVLVVNGDIYLKSSSMILGNVRAMNGQVVKETGAFVEGYTEQSGTTASKRYARKYTRRAAYTNTFKPYFLNETNILDDNFLFRYNRVEGVFIGFGAEKKFYWDGSKSISGAGSFGYGFTSHRWRLQLGLDRQFAMSENELYEAGAEVHSLTDSKDEWIMNLAENNLSSIFFREDFRDYYQREGFSVHTARYTKDGEEATMIDLRYTADRYSSMYSAAQWGVFGNRSFRSNPMVSAGMMKSVSLSGGMSNIDRYRSYSEGWNIFIRGEYGGRMLGGDFDFTQAVIDIRRFQPVTDDDQLNIRVRLGALEGTPLTQKIFDLGGANTIPAFGFKEFSGNRMLLANVEYRVSEEIIDEIFFWPSSFSLIAFGDAGAVTTVNTNWAVYEGFNSFTSSQIRSDYGFAIGWHDGNARLGFAWRTDKQAPVSIFFRLHRAF